MERTREERCMVEVMIMQEARRRGFKSEIFTELSLSMETRGSKKNSKYNEEKIERATFGSYVYMQHLCLDIEL